MRIQIREHSLREQPATHSELTMGTEIYELMIFAFIFTAHLETFVFKSTPLALQRRKWLIGQKLNLHENSKGLLAYGNQSIRLNPHKLSPRPAQHVIHFKSTEMKL